jgi:hypothetical protein
MKILKKALLLNNNVLEECKVLITDEHIKILLSGRVYSKLLDNRSSLSLIEYKTLSKLKGGTIIIGVNDLLNIRYYRISGIDRDLIKVFNEYLGSNTNIYDVYLETRGRTYRFILTQRDMIKLRNYVRKSLHSNK